jgi:hypothetical protein
LVIGLLLITGYNPFKQSSEFDLTGYQAWIYMIIDEPKEINLYM